MSEPQQRPPEPRPAATVIVMRDAPDSSPPDIFMVERTAQASAFGGLFVFPGGKVDPGDIELEERCNGLTDAEASARLGIPSGGLAYWIACIRECFEEAGLLLGLDSSGAMLNLEGDEAQQRFGALRAKLNAGEISFAEICRSEDITLATDRLAYCSHWITPEQERRRFDTRFFIAAAPATQRAVHDGGETVSSRWIDAASALAALAEQRMNMIPPTFMNLRTLVDFADSEAALGHFRSLPEGAIPPITPSIFKDEDGSLKLRLSPEGPVLDLSQASKVRR
ncbi:MAG: NUDIX hydrolase [Gammaproteobacteria bacterium AqS3]|nr:NUDIX hydrolase [Gammaproteobacteria bacterium AqS3]